MALVITIIILIILAGITLGWILGKNGIIGMAENAGKNYLKAEQEENNSLEELYSLMSIATNDNAQVNINVKQLLDIMYPVGSIYITASNTNPQELFGGEWESYGEGRTLIGAGEGTDINNETVKFVENSIGGEYNHKLTVEEMPSHTHAMRRGGSALCIGGSISGVPNSNGFSYANNAGWWFGHNKDVDSIASSGGSNSHNNMPPYIVTYMWKRVQ